ncbi:MAG: chalcone isomerase family protein [Undibacterium sp.]|uniref:chalcone isomerase family protein n=1 Tax=Undibacterium sp. TaxID=1914977 RepID=UPI002724F539|nr:chalcone isomerase family protein [Undibacterium sp.]MDO8652830.1 chalcone isomerase family protein [Undibacterium sp.]
MNFGLRMNNRLVMLSAVSAMLFSIPAAAVEIAGVKIDETAQVANQQLKLNGAGIRYKVIFKVYTAALYLAEKKTTTPEVLALPGAKRVSLVILRDLSSDDLGQRFMEGIRKNAEMSERAKLVNSMLTFGQMFSMIPEMKKGDVLTVDWIPGTGVVSQYNGKKLGETIQDPNFYNALLKIWLGPNPADEKLKHLLLSE